MRTQAAREISLLSHPKIVQILGLAICVNASSDTCTWWNTRMALLNSNSFIPLMMIKLNNVATDAHPGLAGFRAIRLMLNVLENQNLCVCLVCALPVLLQRYTRRMELSSLLQVNKWRQANTSKQLVTLKTSLICVTCPNNLSCGYSDAQETNCTPTSSLKILKNPLQYHPTCEYF